jgi:hypothetical protein
VNTRSAITLIAATALLLIVCKPTDTTGSLSGTIRDRAGAALVGARVLTKPTTSVDMTDASGRYLITGVPVGAYKVQSLYTGHVPIEFDVQVRKGETSHVDLDMDISQRNVSAEMLSTYCNCAVPNRMALYRVTDARGDRVTHVEYHSSADTSIEGEEPFEDAGSDDRRLFYNPGFADSAYLYPDGEGGRGDSAEFGRVIDSLMQKTSPVQMKLTVTPNGKSFDITVEMTGVDDIGTNSKLVMGVTENGPIDYVDNTGHSSFVRDLAVGVKLSDAVSIAPGEVKTFTARVSVPDTLSKGKPQFHVVNRANLSAFAILQNVSTRQVHQSVKKAL